MLILPSVDLPNVTIESMNLDKPIIWKNLVGIPEVLENNVNRFIVEVINKEELSDARLEFIKDRNLNVKKIKKTLKSYL